MNEAAYVAMREERDALRAENAYLKALYCQPPETAFIQSAASQLGIMPQVALLLWTLWDCRSKSTSAVAAGLWGDRASDMDWDTIKVQMCRLRKALKPVEAEIETLWGFGFRLSPADRAKIAAAIGIEVKP